MKNFKIKDLLVTIHPPRKSETFLGGTDVLHAFDGGGGKCVSPSKAGRFLACNESSKGEVCTDITKSKCDRPISKPGVCENHLRTKCPTKSTCHEPSSSPKCKNNHSHPPNEKDKKMIANAAALHALKKAVAELQHKKNHATETPA